MFRYLKAAYFERLGLPGLGAVPLNAVLMIVVAILGFGHPAFWLLGVALETAYLAALSTNRRYQRVVDARDREVEADTAELDHRTRADQLHPTEAERLRSLENKCEQAANLARAHRHEEDLIDGNQQALNTLADLYLRLLLARQLLMSPDAKADESRLRRQMDDLRKELAAAQLPQSLRDSKAATLCILERRLQNLQHRDQSMAEVESDLARIEAQVDLAVENAGLSGEPQAVSSNITLVSQWLEPDLRGLSMIDNEAVASADPDPRQGQKEAR